MLQLISVTSIKLNVFNGRSSLANVYYMGTADDWSNINIESNNTYLTFANIYYYSEN